MSRLTRDGTAEPVSRDQILRHVRGQGNINFSCSADHEQNWQPYPVDHTLLYVITIHTYTYINTYGGGGLELGEAGARANVKPSKALCIMSLKR